MTQTIVNLGTGGAALNGQNGSTSGADSNDALFLDWPGSNAGNYVYLSGVNSNFMSVPDAADLDITGDIDIRVQVALDDWTPASASTLLSKFDGSGRSFLLQVTTTGLLLFGWTADNATVLTGSSTVATGLSDGSVKWVRATFDVNNGASGRDIKFFTSDDGIIWTQLGSTVTQATVTSIFSGSSPINVGAAINGTANPVAGKFYRAQVFNGIDGSKVLDVDTSVITTGAATSFTALTGQTVTINRSTAGRKAVAVVSPVWLFGTDDRFVVSNNALINISVSDNFSVILAIRQWGTSANTGRYVGKQIVTPGWRVNSSSTTINSETFIHDGTTANSEGVSNNTAGSLSVTGFRIDRTSQRFVAYANGTFSSGDNITSVGGFINTNDLGIGAESNGGAPQDFELISVAIFRRALSSEDFAKVRAYYQARLS